MKTYPKIQYNKNYLGRSMFAFDKLDGSNLRFEWNKKSGWYKFGSRQRLISENDAFLGDGIPIFLNKYGDDLARIFVDKYKKIQSVTVFCEYFGENSFAGRHVDTDEKDVVLFDVNLYKRGIISPTEFLDNFGKLDIPNIIYDGVFRSNFIDDIKNNIYGLDEGVICKGVMKTKNGRQLWMTKIKTDSWLNKVKSLYGEKAYLEEFK